MNAHTQIARLKAFCLHPHRFIPLTTQHLETAAQAIGMSVLPSEFIIATTNPGHISRFAPCDLWTNIQP